MSSLLLLLHPPLTSTLFPYTTLFRSFYFDNTLFATVNAPANGATSTVSWNTFDSAQRAFDGTRVLTTKVYDSSGLIVQRSEEHTSELQSHHDLVCHLLLEKKKKI